MAVLTPEEAGECKAGGGPQVLQGKQETRDLKVYRDLKDYKAHRGQVEIVAGKETKVSCPGQRCVRSGRRVCSGMMDMAA